LILQTAALFLLLMATPDDYTGGLIASNNLQAASDETIITLERTRCYGPCPVYKVTLKGDGTVTFEGKMIVKSVGTFTSYIDPEEVRRLVEEFKKVDYFSLQDKYTGRKDGCLEWWTDNPSAITSIKVDGKEKSITHYYGCRGIKILDALTELEAEIDKAAQTERWIK
jgi:hypothetical protein